VTGRAAREPRPASFETVATAGTVARATPSDGDLMARVAVGDGTAFATVYDHTIDAVFGSVARFLGDRETAAEVVQEAYLAVWRQADRYAQESGTLLGWILAIARNRAIDRLRAEARRPVIVRAGPSADRTFSIDADAEERLFATGRPVASPSEEDDPEAAAARQWLVAVVRTALGGMPPHERQVLELAYDDGLTQAEIAARLGWPLGTVKTRTRRAFSTLRSLLEGVPEVGPVGLAPKTAARTSVEGGDDGSR
jgi:RNA polymerase sigma-70 factor (ECF subfamily)